MATDIMQLILETLRVQHLASGYYNVTDQFLFLIFFPSLFILAVVYLLANRLFGGDHKGLAMLFAIAFYILSIVYPPNTQISLYAALAPLGIFWYLLILIIGVVWFFINKTFKFGGSKESRFGATMPRIGGALSMVRSKKKALEDVDYHIEFMKGILGKMKLAMKSGDFGRTADFIREFNSAHIAADHALEELSISGLVDVTGKKKEIDQLLKEFNRMDKEFSKVGK